MNMKFDVLCSERTLLGFAKIWERDYKIENESELPALNSWKELLFNKSDIVIDISKESFDELKEDYKILFYLEKSSLGGGSRIRLYSGAVENHINDSDFQNFCSALYLIEDSSIQLSRKYGRIVVSSDEIKEYGKKIFPSNKFLICKMPGQFSSLKSWEDLADIQLPVTDFLLIDNYIISNKPGIDNILALVEALIPEGQNTSQINLAVISGIFNETNVMVKKRAEQWFFELEKALKNKFNNQRIKLFVAIITIKNLNHDRSLLTNYHLLEPLHDFTCFKEGKSIVDTSIYQSTIFSKSGTATTSVCSYESWDQLRKHAKKLIEKSDFTKGDYQENLLLV